MDIHKEYEEQISKKKEYRFTIGKQIIVENFNFSKPIGKFNYKGTEYYYYNCLVKFRQGEHDEKMKSVAFGHHILQIPAATCWILLYRTLQKNKKLRSNLPELGITRISKINYFFSLKE